MKQRVISGVFIALITVVAAYFGGIILDAVLCFIGIYGSYEFIKIRKDTFNVLLYAIMVLTVMGIFVLHKYAVALCLLEILILMSVAVFDEKETFEDACAVLLMSMMIMFGYVLIISYLTDVFAYFVGVKFGKHKLNPRVSPKKTIEGSLGGWFFGCITSFIWAALFHFFDMPMYFFVISSLFLPVVSEIGDLAFSLIKRHYGVKDFSNLIPGHGGILDRLDSHIFCIILFGVLLLIFA